MKLKFICLALVACISGLFGETIMSKSSEILLNGKIVGKAEVLTPVEIVGENRIKIVGVVSENYLGQIQKDIKNGEIYATFDVEDETNFKKIKKLEDDYGEIWYEVEGVYEISKDSVTKDSDTLYNKAKALYEESCSPCHRVHEPNSFTANQWPASFQSMIDLGYVALEEADINLIIKYLQHNAKEVH